MVILSPEERRLLAGPARDGELVVAVEFMRHLATLGRLGEMAEVLKSFCPAASAEGAAVRAYLARRAAGLIGHHHLSRRFPTFNAWSQRHPDWSSRMESASESPDRLVAEVRAIEREVVADSDRAAEQALL